MKVSAAGVAAAILLSVLPLRAEDGAKRVEILSVSGYEPVFSTRFVMPFEHLLRDATGVTVVDIESLPAKFAGNAYSYSLKDAAADAGGETAALENADGFFALSPADPELMKAFLKEARAYPLLPPTYERAARLAASGESRTFEFRSPRAVAKQERGTLATVYRLKIGDRRVDALFFLKATGGLGRLASALKSLPGDASRRIVVSRGTWGFRSEQTTLRGRALWEALEKLGLKVSAVGRGELRNWDALAAYRKDRPDGVQFLSANLDSSGLEATKVVEAGGVKVAFIAVTRSGYAKYLGRDSLKGVTMSSPLTAVRDRVKAARAGADLVVVLSNLSASENARLYDNVRGIDAVIADSKEHLPEAQNPSPLTVTGRSRGPNSPALFLADEYNGVDRLEFSLGPKDAAGTRDIEIRQNQLILDDSYADEDGYPRFTAAEFEVKLGSEAVLIPDARDLFPDGNKYGGTQYPRIVSRDFWTLNAGLMADRTGSEVGVLPVTNIGVPSPGDFGEKEIRNWFGWDDSLVTFELPGEDLKTLIDEAGAQESQESADLVPDDERLKIAVGGTGKGGTIHGVQIDRALAYRVAGSRLLLSNTDMYPALAHAANVEPAGDLQDVVVADLKRRATDKWSAERYVSLMEGRPLRETPFWTINFRDFGFNLTQNVVVRDAEAFAPVSNARIQGYNETQVGVVAKLDVDYRYRTHKLTNTFEMEYSESRLRPPGEPSVFNVPNNRIQYLLTGTENLASFPFEWLGQSIGPSLGLQYDGEVKQLPNTPKRRNIYSAFPGIEIFDGTVVKSLQLTGNIKRDHTLDPVESQYGARLRAVASCPVPVGHGGNGTFQFESWTNYFFRRPNDQPADLLIEGDVNAKLQIPIWRELTLAPFIDAYYFKLKERPISGYSVQSGVSISFSRLWKPQYEKFF